MDRWMAKVAPLLPKVVRSSPAGMELERTAVRVRMMVWLTSGRVSSEPKAAAAAAKAGTPGVTS